MEQIKLEGCNIPSSLVKSLTKDKFIKFICSNSNNLKGKTDDEKIFILTELHDKVNGNTNIIEESNESEQELRKPIKRNKQREE